MNKQAPKKNMSTEELAKIVIDGFAQTKNEIRRIDIKIGVLENRMQEGFELLNDKIDHVDSRLSYQIEGLGRRIDDMAENKISNFEHQKLSKRVTVVEHKVGILPKKS